MTALIQEEGESEVHEIILNERDCISSPPGVYRGIRNDTEEEALMLVMLGAVKPNLPTYPKGSALEELRIKRAKREKQLLTESNLKVGYGKKVLLIFAH